MPDIKFYDKYLLFESFPVGNEILEDTKCFQIEKQKKNLGRVGKMWKS